MSNSKSKLPNYSFLPWLRKGIASNITTVDNQTLPKIKQRAKVKLSVDLRGYESGKEDKRTIPIDIHLMGPGDIVGINPTAIVRTEPRNWVTDFEPNYFPFIEFYDEDFPWRYTPARADTQHRLRPWLFLIVLTKKEFSRNKQLTSTLPSIIINVSQDKVFPHPEQTWAWSHVYVSQDISVQGSKNVNYATTKLEGILKTNPDMAASRLICPRKLKPNTGYYAFLIPSFETGRLAGLGKNDKIKDVYSLKPSWDSSQGITNKLFPVYYEWYFRTSVKGDFEYLVSLLEPRTVDKRVGIRDMDMQDPGFGVEWKDTLLTLGLEGALRSPKTESTQWPPDLPANTPKFLTDLEKIVNLQDDLQKKSGSVLKPVITPPMYGKWHAITKKLDIGSKNWVQSLNKDPRTRTTSGFGTLVVQKNQEEYMHSAWKQVGNIIAANQQLKQGQLAVEASFSNYKKYFMPLCVEQVLSITTPVHNKVLMNSQSIKLHIKKSKTPEAAYSSNFRSMTSPRRAIMQRMGVDYKQKPGNLLKKINQGILTAAPPKKAPENQIYINDIGNALIPSWVPNWLKPVIKYSPEIIASLFSVAIILLTMGLPLAWVLAVVAALVGLFFMAKNLSNRVKTASFLNEKNLTPEALDSIPKQKNFKISDPEDPAQKDRKQNPDTEDRFRRALKDLFDILKNPEKEPDKPLFDAQNAYQQIMKTIDPRTSIPKRILSFVHLPKLPFLQVMDLLHPIMAHPDFPQPMYEPLSDISTELLIPNLDLIPQNTLSLLETNQKFIESYMMGLNHEMSRELLWREYPTDQRGSYFRQFWDVSNYVNQDKSLTKKQLTEKLRDIKPIHTWSKSSELGSHNNREKEGDKTQLVLVIRGDLLKRYPNTVIYAQKAIWKNKDGKDVRVLEEKNPKLNKKYPLYGAEVKPDISFIGFNLTADKARGIAGDKSNSGWFFVLQERPGEPRFGLDASDEAKKKEASSSNDLSWGHIVKNTAELKTLNCIDLKKPINADKKVTDKWNTNSADLATILYQVPVMVAVHASDMLPVKK